MKKFQFDFIKNVSEMCQRFGFLPTVADWIGCQFALESNYGQSRIARVKNNYCGMKVPVIRPSLNKSGSGFASFDSLFDCVIDYMLLLSYRQFGYNEKFNLELFKLHLKAANYCPDDDYLFAIDNLFKSFKSYSNGKNN